MLLEKCWLLCWSGNLRGQGNQDHDECKEASKESVKHNDQDESYALYCLRFSVDYNHRLCLSESPLEVLTERWLLKFIKQSIFAKGVPKIEHLKRRTGVVILVAYILGRLLSSHSNLALCHNRDAEA